MTDISVVVNLPGALSGPVKHVSKQVGTVDISPVGSKTPQIITRKIKHNDRVQSPCFRVFPIQGNIVKEWVKGECPYWVHPKQWKKMTNNQRIMAHLSLFDVGFGVSFS